MRLAFVDTAFGWPPPGGAQADLFHTMKGLQTEGYEVQLFATVYEDTWRFGDFDPGALPFPSMRIPCLSRARNRRDLARRIRQAVDAWRPDVVFACFGRFVKPYVLESLLHYPLISRYYMYEHLCIRDFCLWKEEETCPNDFLRTPNVCRRCALACWSKDIVSGRPMDYAQEFLVAETLRPHYYRRWLRTLAGLKAAIVNNDLAKDRLKGYCPHVCIIPGGVNIDEYALAPRTDKGLHEKKVILMTGRIDDPLKGLKTLLDAGQGLSKLRNDFEVWVTGFDPQYEYPWLKQLGWQEHSAIMKLYQQADICAVPSVWQEPFGLVAVEAMAAGLPVCASRVGGLQNIVRDRETGFLFEAEQSAELALYLDKLLNDSSLRRRMGEAGRRRAESEYDWKRIIATHYPPLLERVTR